MKDITDALISETEDWSGWLVQPKKEWLNPGEIAKPHVVLEDRGDKILVQLLPQYRPENIVFGTTECFFKYAYDVIDTEIQDR